MIPLPFAKDRSYAVLGLARSGLSAARALTDSGATVLAWDDKQATREQAQAVGVPLQPLDEIAWQGMEGLVLSPGIPHSFPKPHPVTAAAQAAGVALISDVELLAQAAPQARFVGITGTNGKSTTTALIGHLLAQAGAEVAVGGNLGQAVLTLPALGVGGIYVLELSSYQLELVHSLTCDVALLLNITADHLDRHGGFEGYISAKKRIFRNQGAGHTAIVGVDEEPGRQVAAALEQESALRVLRLSVERHLPGGLYLDAGWLVDDCAGKAERLVETASLPRLPGNHNAQNIAAAYAACRALGFPRETLLAALASFPGLAHRQELVAEHQGLRFVNDSKATNAEAAAKALSSYDAIYWIAGGRAKEGGLSGLEPLFPRIRHAFLIGEAQQDFARVLAGKVTADCCGEMATAVRSAAKAARKEGIEGAVVLLSPACASFDQYPDFEARGEAFRAAVAALREEQAA